ncbi:PAS domain-containing protein [Suttonella ornithocola]|uniref:Aerotaxis receptor n=1 Tax=Suttonella ornithocola TaxID=279832 RepID=A0A380MNG6_9GAMM|nr:PAS domain-containing protein [Suttonella ornithocola]SUO93798.1 Aerotaxis receptor [Suttonella ornithocola]
MEKLYTLPPMLPSGEKHRIVPFEYFDAKSRNLVVCPKHYILRDGILLVSRTDIHGVITHANTAFCATSGYDSSELIGSPHNIVRHPDMPRGVFANMWQTLLAGSEWRGYVKNLRKDGGYYWVHATIQPLFRDGAPYSFTSVRRKVDRDTIKKCEAIYAEVRKNEE